MENNNNEHHGGDGGKFQNSGQTFLILIIAAVVTFFIYMMVRQLFAPPAVREISYSEFLTMVDNGQVQRVDWSDYSIAIYPKKKSVLNDSAASDPGSNPGESQGAEPDTGKNPSAGENKNSLTEQNAPSFTVVPVNADAEALVDRLYRHGVVINRRKPDNTGVIIETLLGLVLPFALLFIIMNTMMRRMGGGSGMMGVGKSTAKMYMQRETGVSFKDVAGEDEAKESLVEIVDFLHNPAKYTAIGAKLPKGALLVGPPGTGKTLLAKAVAGEAEVPFYSLSGSDFVEMFVGVGASRVRDLFKNASQTAPCIIFIDEIDAIGKTRDSHYGGNDEREQTLNQLLSEMDGFDASKGIMVMGATNRPEILDPALLRPGRFDRRIIVEKPDLKGRVNILKVHAAGIQLDETVNFDDIALATSGAVGADLANMMNEAAITAVKAGRERVSQRDLFEAVEVVLVGKEKKDRILSQKERRIVSYHEVGHALVSAVQKHSEPVQKITIVPRTMGALGYVMQVPEEEKYLNTKAELHAMLVTKLAGRAAEEIIFDTVTTGASNDIEEATKIARAMVTQYGMSDKFGLMGLETRESRYLSGKTIMNCGDETATEVDHEVMRILKDAYQEAKGILMAHRPALDTIAVFLIERETITGKEFMRIFRDTESEHPTGAGALVVIPEESEGKQGFAVSSEKTGSVSDPAEKARKNPPGAEAKEKKSFEEARKAYIEGEEE